MSFLKEVENRESPNSRAIVEASLDEIPLTSGFNSQMPQSKDVESPNSHVVFEVNLNEIPLTLDVNSVVPRSPTVKVSAFHVIFYLNKVLITTRFDKGSCTVIPHLGLKEFLEKYFAQF